MARNTSMRVGRRYSMTEHGQTQSGFRTGNHLLKPGVADIWQLGFEKGPSTFRILPGLNPSRAEPGQPHFDPYRFPADHAQDPLGFGDFIRAYPACRGFGDPQVTFIHQDPADAQGDQQMTPGWVLYRAIDRAVAAGQDRPGWAALTRGGRGRGAQLPRPSYVYLVQVVVMAHNGKAEERPRGLADKTIVLELGQSAGMALIAELKAEREGFQGDPNDFDNRYLNGDPVSLNHGRFVTFYTKSQGDPRRVQQQPVGSWNSAVSPQQGPGGRQGGGMEEKGYGCFMDPVFNGIPAQLAPYEQVVRARALPWDDILQFPTIEQQAAYLADKFPPEIIEYAWRDHRHWISEDVQRRIVAAVSAQVPGYPMGYGGPPPMQQFPGQGAPMYGAAPPMPQSYMPQPEQQPGMWGGPPQMAIPSTGFGVAQAAPQQQQFGQPTYGQQPEGLPAPQPQPQTFGQQQLAPPPVQYPPTPNALLAPQHAPPPPAQLPAGAMGWGMGPNPAVVDTGVPSGAIPPGIPPGAVPSASVPMAPLSPQRASPEMLPAQPIPQSPPQGFDARPQQAPPQQYPQQAPQQQYPMQQQPPQAPPQQYPPQQPQQPQYAPQQPAPVAMAPLGPPAGPPAGMPAAGPRPEEGALARAQARAAQGGAPR